MNQKTPNFGLRVLPNLVSSLSLLAAFYAILSAGQGHFEAAVFALYFALLADEFDGRIARWTNTCSRFGAELDSLSDNVAFGVAPGILLYYWQLHTLGHLGWLIAFLYSFAVTYRLARFNTQNHMADSNSNYFQGLPCPPAAAVVVSFVLICYQYEIRFKALTLVTAIFSLLIALLMISHIPFPTFKQIHFKHSMVFWYFLLTLGLVVALIIAPAITVMAGFGLYIVGGLLAALFRNSPGTPS